MSTDALPRPGLRFGPYPQRQPQAHGLWWEMGTRVADHLGDALLPRAWLHGTPARRRARRQAALEAVRVQVEAQAQKQAQAGAAGDATLIAVDTLRAELRRHGLAEALVPRALLGVAAAIEATLGLRPHDTQLQAAWALLDNRLVELDTGEGKSLAILMAAGVAALAGVPVHVVTANDYLAARDAEQAARALAPLGLTVGAIDAALDADERRAVYARDVVYATAREIGFDYLRDQLQLAAGPAAALAGGPEGSGAPPALVLRGLNMALIDEADSVLIDHARTPLVIARPSAHGFEPAVLACVWQLSAQLGEGRDFTLDRAGLRAEPADAAVLWLHQALAQVPGASADRRLTAQWLGQALVVRHVLQRDRHYLVQAKADSAMTEHEVVLIDGTTGRAMPGTQWTRGLHQLVSIKEGCPPPPLNRVAEQITLQTLFSRYWRLCGTSGTLRESRVELFTFFRLGVVRIEPRRPSRRQDLGVRVLATEPAWLDAVAASAARAAQAGRAVLIGTESVARSESLAAALRARGMACGVINAKEEGDEREAVVAAGRPGAVTVTTNKAGRGTDIPLDTAVLQAGGLHVICAALNPSRRIDRQLAGRTARNGAPGTVETVLCLGSGALCEEVPSSALVLLHTMAGRNKVLPVALGRVLRWAVQEKLTWREFRQRWQMVVQDRRMRELLAHARGAV